MNPFHVWSAQKKAVCVFTGATLMLVVLGVLLRLDRPLRTTAAPYGMVSYAWAGEATRSRAIVRSWEENDTITHARWTLSLSLALLVFCSTTLALACFMAGERWAARWTPRRDQLPREELSAGPGSFQVWRHRAAVAVPHLMYIAGWLQWVAAVLGSVGIVVLFRMLRWGSQHDMGGWPEVAVICGMSWVAIVAVGVAIALVAVRNHPQLRKVFNRTYRPWFEWLGRYPLLVLVAWSIAYLGHEPDPARPGFGIPYLFRHEDCRAQFFAGIAVAMLIFELCFVGYLLDAARPWMRGQTSLPGHGGASAGAQRAPLLQPVWRRRRWCYLAWTCGPLWIFVMANSWMTIQQPLSLFSGVLIGATFSLVVDNWLDSWTAKRCLLCLAPQPARSERPRTFLGLFRIPEEEDLARLHSTAGVFFLLILLAYSVLLVIPFEGRLQLFFSPAVAICILLGLIVSIYGRLRFQFPQRSFGVLLTVVVVAVVLMGISRYPHKFPALEEYYQPSRIVSLSAHKGAPIALADSMACLEKWYQRQTVSDAKPKLIVVSVSGGGLRAAVWTMVVLAELEKQDAAFPYRVRLITGTSGGMLGAAYYVQSLPRPSEKRSGRAAELGRERRARGRERRAAELSSGRAAELDQLIAKMARESLGPVAQAFVLHDLPGSVLRAVPVLRGLTSDRDRGVILEETWEKNTGGALAATLASLDTGEREGWRPSLVFSPMLVEDGRRLLISNLDLSYLADNRGSELDGDGTASESLYSRSAVEFFRLFPETRDTLRLSTAVRMNASFPFISPAGVLPTDPPRRVADAGYYDNWGVNVAALWLADLVARKPDGSRGHQSGELGWLDQHVSGVVLVQIRDQPTETARTRLAPTEAGPGLFARGLSWLTTPADAVFSARESTMSFRNDEQVRQLDQILNTPDRPHFFTTVVFELEDTASLSWYLTPDEIQRIRSGMSSRKNARRLKTLQMYLNPRFGHDG